MSDKIVTTLKEYLLMTAGMCFYAFGWIGCILPARCMGGGASGLSLLIYYFSGETISIGTMVFIINAILLLIAGFIIGWKFGKGSRRKAVSQPKKSGERVMDKNIRFGMFSRYQRLNTP